VRRFLVVAATVMAVSPLPAQVVPSRPSAMPVDPISGILDAFRTHAVVALGEGGHGNEQAHRFRLVLVRDPRFARVVNDIVVESGSARYQTVMDRFVAGDDVPREVLVRAWRDTTQPSEIWDLARGAVR
jgi:erythromycin esterase-like protein